jgi:formylglycine-generating enzyme required for sulfatase activity
MLSERFAFCQTMPMDEFLTTAEGLRKSGYRPNRFRPYIDDDTIRVAAVWTRDGLPWRLAQHQSSNDICKIDEQNRKEGYAAVDVAGYVAVDSAGKMDDRYAAAWVEKTGTEKETWIHVGVSPGDYKVFTEGLKAKGLIPWTQQAMRGSEGLLTCCGVWGKPPSDKTQWQMYWGPSEAGFEQNQASQGDKLLFDIAIASSEPPQTTRQRAEASLKAAEKTLEATPDDLNARFARATAHLRVGENQKAIDDFNAVIEKAPQRIDAYQPRAVAHARAGHKEEARADLEQFQKGNVAESQKLYLAVVVAAIVDEGTDKALEAIETALKKQPEESVLYYNAACAYSLASGALAQKDHARSQTFSERAIGLLRKAIQIGYANYQHMQEDADLDPLRVLPAFADIMKSGHLDRSYAAIWKQEDRFEATPFYGLDPATHLQRCRGLVLESYRIASLSIARTSPEGASVTASVWHRPVMPEEKKDQLAERQARAAIALLRMGNTAEVVPWLRHSADPRLRSFIIQWLNPLGADPRILAAELDRLPVTTKPTPNEGQQFMDAILFHPETSQRRALILALGTYGKEGLSPGEREPLIAKLLDLYRNDPDSGIHGAAGWTLRQWGQQARLQVADAELMKLKERGDRRWYVNSQGQTFAVIEGPVEFRMGSPPSDPDRFPQDLMLHRMTIPRRFAIADREVSVEQYQRFVQSHPQFGLAREVLNRFGPEATGPMIAVTWYGAVAYCNWLSEQEGLPRDQWCYLPTRDGAYATGMTIPADVLKRTGYRLPTEAEWEWACRSGTITKRYYGQTTNLLSKHAWYLANSPDHAQPCGSLIPNDLGLFDMLGNVYEWMQDRIGYSLKSSDNINISESIKDTDPRLVRGGGFDSRASLVRSAFRNAPLPPDRLSLYGFRPSRTYP